MLTRSPDGVYVGKNPGMRFVGKTVIVTGSGRGIGADTARGFAAEGARVVVTDRDGESAAMVASSIPGAIAIPADVTSPHSMADLVMSTKHAFGRVDILVNNAARCTDSSFLDLSEEDARLDLLVTLGGPIFASQAVLPTMLEQGAGVILNVASVNGISYFGNEAYSAAKAGVINLTKALATQYGALGIRVNAVAPGTIRTEAWQARIALDPEVLEKVSQWYPLGRVGEPGDVTRSLMFLASDDAAWITGVTLPVEGGILAGNLPIVRTIMPQPPGSPS